MPAVFARVNPSADLLKKSVPCQISSLQKSFFNSVYCQSRHSANSQILPVSSTFNFRIYRISLFLVTRRFNLNTTSLNTLTTSSLMSRFNLAQIFIELLQMISQRSFLSLSLSSVCLFSDDSYLCNPAVIQLSSTWYSIPLFTALHFGSFPYFKF